MLNSLQETIYLVSAGLQVKDKINPESLTLATKGIPVNIVGGLMWNSQQLYENYFNLILTNGFRDAIEGVNLFLESVHSVLSIWELIEKQNNKLVITGNDWNEMIVGETKKFHRLGFPGKFLHLEKMHKIYVDPKSKMHTLSINSARNCLVHRNGIVTHQDLTVNDVLEVKYSRLKLFIKNDKAEDELIAGMIINKGEKVVSQQTVEEVKKFKINESIKFASQEFSDIIWSLIIFGNDMIQRINEYGAKKGYIKQNVDTINT